jgi:RNA polymerase sigma-70 factor (ECF subfamily)
MWRPRLARSGAAQPVDLAPTTEPVTAEGWLTATARGDERAFERLYDLLAPAVFGLVRQIVRDQAQSEEVTQEIFIEVWRTASRYQADRGSAQAWVLTIAHRRAVDRVRAAQAATNREQRSIRAQPERDFDQVAEKAIDRIERARVHTCLETLTDLQRQSIMLAYYSGHTYREVAALLNTPIGTIKTRMRDGLIRLRDCLGVSA